MLESIRATCRQTSPSWLRTSRAPSEPLRLPHSILTISAEEESGSCGLPPAGLGTYVRFTEAGAAVLPQCRNDLMPECMTADCPDALVFTPGQLATPKAPRETTSPPRLAAPTHRPRCSGPF